MKLRITLCVLASFLFIGIPVANADGLRILSGIYSTEIGDDSDMMIGVTFTGDEVGDFAGGMTWGYDLKLTTSLGDFGPADGPGVGFRFWPSIKHELNDGMCLKIGFEYLASSVGDDFGGSYSGLGGKIAFEQDWDDSFLHIGFGFNSGDSENYFSGSEGEDDLSTFDLMYGIKGEEYTYGLDIQRISADVGADVNFTGVFMATDW